jgi:hypothetical protein
MTTMSDPQTQDQRRLGEAETDIGVLKSDAQTTARLLAGIAATMKELTAAQYPPFADVVKTFSSGIVAASIFLGGFFYLTNAQIDNKTAQLHARVARLEAAIVYQPSFTTVIEKIVKNP